MAQAQVALERTMLSIQATPDIAGIRTAEFRGQEHTVIPAVALVEGVLWPVNSPAPELALAEEFGRFPGGWDGRPVVYGHPFVDGKAVSASSPDILETNAFGQLFNTVLEGKKLKTEIWINNSLVESLSEEGQKVVEDLKNGEGMVEVSTGMFIMSEKVQGEFNGEVYESIWRNIVPDHFAVLAPGTPGACSIADGCGAPRTNEMQPVMRAAQLNGNCNCDVPVVTEEEEEPREQKGLFKRLLELGGGILNFREQSPTDLSEHLSDTDLRAALIAGLAEAEPNEFVFILAIFANNKDAGRVIFEKGFSGELFSRDFKVSSAGAVTLKGDSTRVRPITQFLPVEVITDNESHSTDQENAMNKEELVNGLIANAATQYVEDDREWLSALEEDQLAKMAPAEASQTPEEIAAAEATAEATAAAEAAESADTPVVSTEDYIAAAPAEIQAVLNSSVQLHQARKKALVDGLVANARCQFSKESLESKPIDELENISALAGDISYAGGAPTLTANREDDSAIPAAPLVFELNPQRNADAA